MKQRLLFTAALLGALGVIGGAFGAHALRSRIPPESLENIKTGVYYLFIHVMAAIVCLLSTPGQPLTPYQRNSALSFIGGGILFTGSLYVLATATLTHIPTALAGPLTPLGGMGFIAGWVFLAFHLKNKA